MRMSFNFYLNIEVLQKILLYSSHLKLTFNYKVFIRTIVKIDDIKLKCVRDFCFQSRIQFIAIDR